MPVSSIKATVDCDTKKVWDIVTDVESYPVWRSDLSRTEILSNEQFIEYTKSGYATIFTTTLKKPYKRWEFDIDNSNISGHCVGVFLKKKDKIIVEFTEDVTAKKWFLKPIVRSYLRKQQKQFVIDLKKEIMRKQR